MQMQEPSGFDQNKQLSRLRDLHLKQVEQLTQTSGVGRQILFIEQAPVDIAQGETHFVFGGIEAEEVCSFH